jgi:hydrogenase maturation protein HypF
MGRLFDAVASMVGIRNDVTYEAQAAIEMEALSKPFLSSAKTYPYLIDEKGSTALICLKPLLSAVVGDVSAQEPVGRIAARFHQTIAQIAIDICKRARESTRLNEVALSGGVWQNQILLDLVRDGLEQEEFVLYFHKHVPTNDGGLALGQAVIANYVCAEQTEPVGAGNQSGF